MKDEVEEEVRMVFEGQERSEVEVKMAFEG